MSKIQKTMNGAVILSELSHVFCCGLPAFFSMLGLLSGLGLTAFMPSFLQDIHRIMHVWEVPLLVTSGIILMLGWLLHHFSGRLNCEATGCSHPPCGPVKRRSNVLLIFATFLFAGNVIFYLGFHSGLTQEIFG